jgi:hypothetical protein
LAVIGLCLSGNISFGHGMGDVTYLFTLIVSTIIYLVLIRAINRKEDVPKKEAYNLIVATVFLFIALSITYKFTIGRGPENSWNNTLAILPAINYHTELLYYKPTT